MRLYNDYRNFNVIPVAASSCECTRKLIEKAFLRYGKRRKLISYNDPQFVSAVLQQVCCTIGIEKILTQLCLPQANPVERKNRDLKHRLAILMGHIHDHWSEKLSNIRFALNSSKSVTTRDVAAYLQFGLKLLTIDDVFADLKAGLDNIIPEMTQYLRCWGIMLNDC
ncbi:endonuclease [Caerostris darwini]|uniref:Endonuclease n=1 Tax=Caerostris darwini TaxID=1538125 RepID=A0AAV4RKT0_9ARAC|nr:endonuclease [Caerostris darwini]